MKPKKPSHLASTGVNSLGFNVYESAYFKLSVEEMDTSYDKNKEHHGALTVWVDYYELQCRFPVIIEKSGFRYVPSNYYCYEKTPLYTSYYSHSSDHGIPSEVIQKIRKLVRDIRKRQVEDTTQFLVRKWLTILQQQNIQLIQAEAIEKELYLVLETFSKGQTKICVYRPNPRFPCRVELAAKQLNEKAIQ